MKVSFGESGRELTGPVYDGICLRQEFVAKSQKLISVEVYFATYMRENPGLIIVDVRDQRQRVIADARIDATRLEDNSMREFGLGAPLRIGCKYELRVYTQNCRSGESPTCAYGSGTEGGPLFVGARLVRERELNCIFNYEKVDPRAMPPLPNSTESERPPIPDDAIGGLISVVIPHFNCPDLLYRTLASLARQTYSCIEVIVVDDGSQHEDVEKAKAVIESFRWAIPSLLDLWFKNNQGACAARNHGSAYANGEYLFFCDADIELYPEAFEILLKTLLKHQSAAFAYGGFVWGAERVPPIPFDLQRLRKSNYVTTMSLMRSHYFPGWDEELKRHQDWDMWLTITDEGNEGVCCGKYIFETPVRDGISTNENIDMMKSRDIVARKHRSNWT